MLLYSLIIFTVVAVLGLLNAANVLAGKERSTGAGVTARSSVAGRLGHRDLRLPHRRQPTASRSSSTSSWPWSS